MVQLCLDVLKPITETTKLTTFNFIIPVKILLEPMGVLAPVETSRIFSALLLWGGGGVLAKCRSTIFSASGQHSTSKKIVNKMQLILDQSTIYNEKQVKSTILTKVCKNGSSHLHIFFISYLQSTTFWPKTSSTIYMF